MTERDTTVNLRATRPGMRMVDRRVQEYACAHTSRASPELAALRAETEARMAVPALAAGIVESRLLEALVVATRATRVLDVGTFTGASALSMASRLPAEGTVITIERELGPAELAQSHFERSRYGARIEPIVGDARDAIRRVAGPFDLVFLDAWKKDYWAYYEAVLPKVAGHGLIVADNVLWRGFAIDPPADDEEAIGISEFADRVQGDDRVDNALLTVGDGLLLIWRRRG